MLWAVLGEVLSPHVEVHWNKVEAAEQHSVIYLNHRIHMLLILVTSWCTWPGMSLPVGVVRELTLVAQMTFILVEVLTHSREV